MIVRIVKIKTVMANHFGMQNESLKRQITFFGFSLETICKQTGFIGMIGGMGVRAVNGGSKGGRGG